MIRRQYTLKPDTKDLRDIFAMAPRATAVKIPDSLDLRSHFPVVRDQGSEGSCTAHAWSAALDYQREAIGRPTSMFSRRFIYYWERALEGTINEDAGAQLRSGAKVLAKYGAPEELLWPYVTQNFATAPSDDATSAALRNRIGKYQRVRCDIKTIQLMLAQRYCVVVGLAIFESFESAVVARSGVLHLPKFSEARLGRHAVVIVGYTNMQRFIVRNSWGESWGQSGYFTVPFDYISAYASDCWSITGATTL